MSENNKPPATTGSGHWLDRPIDPSIDHVLGAPDAPITLVEYGSYDCNYCRAAHERVVQLRSEFGDQLAYAYRHRPIPGNEIARRAAEVVERAQTPKQFWKAHVALMASRGRLHDEDLETLARERGLPGDDASIDAARARVRRDIESAAASGVVVTPTFFINGRRYEGPWDDASLSDAMLGSLGHRVRVATLDFVNWAPSTGVLLLLAAVVAVVLTNTTFGPAFAAFWQTTLGVAWEGRSFGLPLLQWVNDGLLTIFFLVVGLEIKREFTVGHLASRRLAALPVAGAIGGMVVPALLFLALTPAGPWQAGWGVPIATDTAFAVAIMAAMGDRVPIELRIFLTAAAIVDDIAAIAVVALFYSDHIDVGYLGAAGVVVAALYAINKASIYRVTPYAVLGLLLWFFIHESGVHATLAGVILALFIPTRPPPAYRTLYAQADAIFTAETAYHDEAMGPSLSHHALRALDAIHDRLESPAQRLLRNIEIRSSYIVLPIFALANAGVVLSAESLAGRHALAAGIFFGLVVGKPVGLLLASWIAVRMGLAEKPAEYDWMQVAGAGCLAGIGFTMSLFIAGQAFPVPEDFQAAKMAIFAASLLAAVLGIAVLWHAAARRA